jgi:DNA polymerase III subunit delta
VTANPLSAQVTLLHGENQLEINERVRTARETIDPTGLSTSTFENASSEIADIASAVGSPGFFGADRIVICHDLITPTSGRRKKSADGNSGDPLAFLGTVAPGVWVIVIEKSLKSADEKRVRSLSSNASVEEVAVPRGRTLIDWACERARQHGAVLDGATATRLVEALYPGTWRQAARRDDIPPDLYRLDSEIAKLAIAAGSNGEISGAMISELISNEDALDIWGLSNAIADRDQAKAIKQLELALDSGQPPEQILGQLVAQFETFAVVNAAKGRSNDAVASRTGLSEGRLRQASRSARNYDRTELSRAVLEIRDVDFGIKQGLHEPEDAIVSLVAGLARRKRK